MTTEMAGRSLTLMSPQSAVENSPRFQRQRFCFPCRQRELARDGNISLLDRSPRPGAKLLILRGVHLDFIFPARRNVQAATDVRVANQVVDDLTLNVLLGAIDARGMLAIAKQDFRQIRDLAAFG